MNKIKCYLIKVVLQVFFIDKYSRFDILTSSALWYIQLVITNNKNTKAMKKRCNSKTTSLSLSTTQTIIDILIVLPCETKGFRPGVDLTKTGHPSYAQKLHYHTTPPILAFNRLGVIWLQTDLHKAFSLDWKCFPVAVFLSKVKVKKEFLLSWLLVFSFCRCKTSSVLCLADFPFENVKTFNDCPVPVVKPVHNIGLI